MEARPDLLSRIATLSLQQQEALARRLADRPAVSPRPAITRRPVSEAPLCYAQQRLWFLDQLDPGSPHYNVALAAPVHGHLDLGVLQRSMNEIARRHEALRTTFTLDDDENPVQVIHENADAPLEITDLSHLTGPDRDAAASARVAEMAKLPFDLGTGPLIRAWVIRLAADEHVVAASMHHIVSDVWTVEIILRELAITYTALLHGQRPPLPEPPFQYSDFAFWQREWLQGEMLDKQAAYWRQQLAGDLPLLALPADRPRPAQQTFRGAVTFRTLPADLSKLIEARAAEQKTTPFAAYLTATAMLLHRYSEQPDIVIGAPVSNRSQTDLEGMVGYLGNMLALRVDLSGDPTFAQALSRAHEMTQDAFANQDLPFEKIVEIAQPERDLSRTPIIQVVLVYRVTNDEGGDDGPLRFGEPLPIDNGTTKFDLSFAVDIRPAGHQLAIEYSTDLFDPETIDRMFTHLQVLLTAAVANPDLPIGSLPLLEPAERRQILVDWNATEAPFPGSSCLHELIDARAAATPSAIAATSDGQSISYDELARKSSQLAHHLVELGAGPDIPVAVCLHKSLNVAVGLVAVLKAGSAYLPVDPKAPAARLAEVLADGGVRIVLTESELGEKFAGYPDASIALIDHDWPRIATRPTSTPVTGVRPDHLAYVIYTSGSAGRPKGVMVDHRGRVNNFHDFNTRFGIGPGDCVLALSSLNFDMSAYDTLGTLMSGARIAYPAPGTDRDPAHWLDKMTSERVTVWHSVPALLEMLVEYAESEEVPGLPDLRLVLLGGDWIPTTLPDRIRRLAPTARVICLGGATEVSMDSTIYEVDQIDPGAASIPYGKPMANQRCYVLDPSLRPVPIGVAGELFLAGVGVGRGYLGDPELTARKFLGSPLPEEPGTIYRTGDIARFRPDGNLELIGRADYQIKIRGYRIEPAEVQAALRHHPAVRDALVTAHADPNGVKQLVAYIITDEPVPPAELRETAARLLPESMIPSAIVEIDRFPLTANGKIDRRSLPAPPVAENVATYVPPQTPAERVLVEVWQELLGSERIGVTDNFFALGGDSIKAIQAIARSKKRGVVVQPKDLFQHQTVRELAEVAVVGGAGQAAADQVFDAPLLSDELLAELRGRCPLMEDAYPLPPMQAQMLSDTVERPVPGLYVIQADYLFVAGGLDVDRLIAAWQAVIDRHPVLRTSFEWAGLDQPVQIVSKSAQLPVEHHDLRGLTLEEQLRRQDEIIAEDRIRGYDLTRAPLLRLHFLRLDDDAYKYISSNHHIILDGWSRATAQQEVFAVYESLQSGGIPQLPAARPFRDYVAWAGAQPRDKAREVWQRYLGGFSGPTPIVAARGLPGASCQGPFAKQRVPLPADTAAELERFTRMHKVTANTVIQGAWFLLLSRYTGQQDVVLGVMSSGRATDLTDIDTMVGLCVNCLPVRTAVDPGQQLLPWLRELQRQQVELREYEHTPVPAIAEWVQADRPLYECMMVFENYPWDGSLSGLEGRIDFSHPLAQPDYQWAQFSLPLRVEVAPPLPLLIMHYYQDSFADATITEMIADWTQMIELLIRHPERPLGAYVAGDRG